MTRPEWWDAYRASVQQHESCKLKPYRDTEGVLTIGWGRNLDANGITQAEADAMLEHDLDTAWREALAAWPWLRTQSAGRQAVIAEMAYNLGVPRLRGFGRMFGALMQGHYAVAADEMLDSKWAAQTKGRARTLAARMRKG